MIGEFGYIFYSNDSGETWNRSQIEGSVVMDPIEVAYNTLEVPEADRAELTEFGKGIIADLHLNVAIEAYASAEEIREFGSAEDPMELFVILEARSQEVRMVI